MAETEILRQGEWSAQQFRATGAMLVEVLAPMELHAGVAVDGLSTALRHRSPHSAAFPLQAVPEEASVLAVSQAQAPFPGGARVDLSVTFPSVGRSFMIQNLDIAGQERAPLVRLTRDGDAWLLQPLTARHHGPQHETSQPERPAVPVPPTTAHATSAGAGSHAAPAPAAPSQDSSATLGSWAARRAAEIGVPVRPQVDELVIDTSVSMAQHRSRVDRLCRFISALSRATGASEPRVREMPIGGSPRAGVGSVLGRGADGDAGDLMSPGRRRVVVTDLPVLHADVQSLVIGDPAILQVLADVGAEILVLDDTAWAELDRDDVSYTDRTVHHLEPLMRWLSLPAPDLKERS